MHTIRYNLAAGLLVAMVSFSVFVGSYFVLAQRGIGNCRWGVINWQVHYRMLGRPVGKVYAPLHSLDRKFLRPQFWQEDMTDEQMILFEP